MRVKIILPMKENRVKKKVLRYDLTYQLSGPKARAQRSQKDRTAPFPLVPPSLKIIDIIYCRTGESGQPQTLALAQNRGGKGGWDGRADLSGTLEEVGP